MDPLDGFDGGATLFREPSRHWTLEDGADVSAMALDPCGERYLSYVATGEGVSAETPVVVPLHARMRDIKPDGANTEADFFQAVHQWREWVLVDADGDRRITILDLFYIDRGLENLEFDGALLKSADL